MRIKENGKIAWSERLEKKLVRRVYESDASGAVDEDLLDEAGYALYARCLDILYIDDFLHGSYRCPRCESALGRGPEMRWENEAHSCPDCGFSMSRGAMRESFSKKQLNPGGAVPAFRAFVSDWQRASTARQKMLVIDAVIHAFHYSLAREPDLPTRAAGVNLIEGKLADVVEFLNDLSSSEAERLRFQEELAKNRELLSDWKGRRQPS